MFFKKEKRDDIREIKDAVINDSIDDLIKPVPQEVQRESTAPLFVKVDKYREVLTHVQEMKIFISGIKQLFGLLNELEAVRSDALKIFRATMQRLENSIAEMDSELLKPRGLNLSDISGEKDMMHIEDSLSDLPKQLMELPRGLREMK